jgi:hypothetical protein
MLAHVFNLDGQLSHHKKIVSIEKCYVVPSGARHAQVSGRGHASVLAIWMLKESNPLGRLSLCGSSDRRTAVRRAVIYQYELPIFVFLNKDAIDRLLKINFFIPEYNDNADQRRVQ